MSDIGAYSSFCFSPSCNNKHRSERRLRIRIQAANGRAVSNSHLACFGLVGQRARVGQRFDALHSIIPGAGDADLQVVLEERAPHVAVKYGLAVREGILSELLLVCAVLDAVNQHVRVGIAPDKRAELHDRDEAGEVVDLLLVVKPIYQAAQVEQLRTGVDLRPEAALKLLLRLLQALGALETCRTQRARN